MDFRPVQTLPYYVRLGAGSCSVPDVHVVQQPAHPTHSRRLALRTASSGGGSGRRPPPWASHLNIAHVAGRRISIAIERQLAAAPLPACCRTDLHCACKHARTTRERSRHDAGASGGLQRGAGCYPNSTHTLRSACRPSAAPGVGSSMPDLQQQQRALQRPWQLAAAAVPRRRRGCRCRQRRGSSGRGSQQRQQQQRAAVGCLGAGLLQPPHPGRARQEGASAAGLGPPPPDPSLPLRVLRRAAK